MKNAEYFEKMLTELTETLTDDHFIDDEGNLMFCERSEGSARIDFDNPRKEVSTLTVDLDSVDIALEMEMLDEYYAKHDPYHDYKAGRVLQMMKEKGFMS